MKDLCVTTAIDKNYQAFLPLFVYCAKKAYPDYCIKIIAFEDLSSKIEYLVEGYCKIYQMALPEYRNIATVSSLRFLTPEVLFFSAHEGPCSHVLFTDVDILIFPEKKPIHEQHLAVMEKNNICYENFALPMKDGSMRMPGVLFASQEWFKRTRLARDYYLDKAYKSKEFGSYREYDEVMLYDICEKSGLNILHKGHENWRWHGIHLGSWRDKKVIIREQHVMDFIKSLTRDDEFMKLLDICSRMRPEIGEIFNRLDVYVNSKKS